MTRTPRLTSAVAALALTAATAATAQDPRPAAAADSTAVAESGRREGRAVAATRSVAGYATLGVITGLLAGGIGIPVLVLGDAHSGVIGIPLVAPALVTLAGVGMGTDASPPPDVWGNVQYQPAAYREAFRTGYLEHLAQRRRRAARIGTVVGGVAGGAAILGLLAHALSSL